MASPGPTGEAWWAEAIAKAAFLGGPSAIGAIGGVGPALPGHHAVLVAADGTRHASPGLQATLR